ncbi:MAG: hypothetical protein GY711_02715 [bacterium]|nr:hypothetical protein [bacterium]
MERITPLSSSLILLILAASTHVAGSAAAQGQEGSLPTTFDGGPVSKPSASALLAGFQGMAEDDLARVHFDAPGDGSLWCAGRTYKARFDDRGATYVPFLGSEAAHNYPLTLRLGGIDLAGEPLFFDDAEAVRRGSVVAFARGSVIEEYRVEPTSIEQRFVFMSLPRTGELTLRIDVETELGFLETAEGFAFEGAAGGVRYGRAFALDAGGERLSIDTVWRGGSIEIQVPAAFLEQATWPVTIDPVITTFAVDTSTFLDILPDVAYDMTNDVFYIVWERIFSATDHDIYGRTFTSAGVAVALGGDYIDITGDDWREPKVANNQIADQFLVVATEGPAGSRVISGRTRDAGTITQGSQFQISGSASGEKVHPDVGGDPSPFGPTYYCVTWERVFNSGVDHDVHARLVRSNSTLFGASTILIDNSGGTFDINPSVSKSNGPPPSTWQNWNIVWQRLDTTNGVFNILGAQLNWDATTLRSTFPIETSTFFNDVFPKVSSPADAADGPRQYLVVYERDDGPPNFSKDIYVSALVEDTLVDRENLSGLEGTGAAVDQFSPSVDSDGLEYAIVYAETFNPTDHDVYAATIYVCDHDLILLEGHQNLAFSATIEGMPEIASIYSGGGSSTHAMATWWDAAVDNDIEGGVYATPGTIGVNYCGPAVPNSSGFSGRIAAIGSNSVAANDLCLLAHHLPNTQFGYFIVSATPGLFMPPQSLGFVCLAGNIGRYNTLPILVGPMDSVNMPQVVPVNPPVPLLPGQTWNFQCWYRDVGNTNNFTDAVRISFVP